MQTPRPEVRETGRMLGHEHGRRSDRAEAASLPSRIPLNALLLAVSFSALLTGGNEARAAAARGPCNVPPTTDADLSASDCLFSLTVAVGIDDCEPFCVCDANGSGNVTAADALLCLKRAVGMGVSLMCQPPCEPARNCEIKSPLGCAGPLDACTAARLVLREGSRLDLGWAGLGQDRPLLEGAALTLSVVRRCVGDEGRLCTIDSDCPNGDTCRPYCDCDDPSNSICEVRGPEEAPRCIRDLERCTNNADCGLGSLHCVRFASPPLPLSAANTPLCLLTYFEEDITGTMDTQTGELRLRAVLRAQPALGISNEMPCPRCGAPEARPTPGEPFTCDGGPKNGFPCTVDAVSRVFGGMSYDCPPYVSLATIGPGISIRLPDITTGETARTAKLPWLSPYPFCTDTGALCSTNAECTRCTSDLGACSSNADCSAGTCAAAPQQPISCGFYLHCGFCGNDPSKPCFGDQDCAAKETCTVGNSLTGKQEQPNDCADVVCGRVTAGRCCNTELDGPACPSNVSTPLVGSCSVAPHIACSDDPWSYLFEACENEDAGACELKRRSCFEHRIARRGEPSPMGSYCVEAAEMNACITNADCSVGPCLPDTAMPATAALLCVPKTQSAAINASSGIPGPAALVSRNVLYACRCGDATRGCNEQCDDGNNENGDGCNQACRAE